MKRTIKLEVKAFVAVCLLMLLVACGSSNRKQQALLQMAGEAALGYYDKHKRLPSSEEVVAIIGRENNESLNPGDRLRLKLHRAQPPEPEKIEISYISADGSEMKRSFRVE